MQEAAKIGKEGTKSPETLVKKAVLPTFALTLETPVESSHPDQDDRCVLFPAEDRICYCVWEDNSRNKQMNKYSLKVTCFLIST